MSLTNAPFGLRPEQSAQGYGTRGQRAIPNGIKSGYATAIYQFQPIKMTTTGVINPVSATTDAFVGTFIGVEYTDSNGKRVVSPQWIANTVATDIVAYIIDDPNAIYEIQADGSVAAEDTLTTAVGAMVNFTNLTANGAGMSQCTANHTPVATGGTQGQLLIVDKGYGVDNDWGDTYTVLRVKVQYHQFLAAKTSI